MSWDFGLIIFKSEKPSLQQQLFPKLTKGETLSLYDGILDEEGNLAWGTYQNCSLLLSNGIPYSLSNHIGLQNSSLVEKYANLSKEIEILSCRLYTTAGEYLLSHFYNGSRVLDWATQGNQVLINEHQSECLFPEFKENTSSELYFFSILESFLNAAWKDFPLDDIEMHDLELIK